MDNFKKYLNRRIDTDDKFENLLEFPKYIEIETATKRQSLKSLYLNKRSIHKIY